MNIRSHRWRLQSNPPHQNEARSAMASPLCLFSRFPFEDTGHGDWSVIAPMCATFICVLPSGLHMEIAYFFWTQWDAAYSSLWSKHLQLILLWGLVFWPADMKLLYLSDILGHLYNVPIVFYNLLHQIIIYISELMHLLLISSSSIPTETFLCVWEVTKLVLIDLTEPHRVFQFLIYDLFLFNICAIFSF